MQWNFPKRRAFLLAPKKSIQTLTQAVAPCNFLCSPAKILECSYA